MSLRRGSTPIQLAVVLSTAAVIAACGGGEAAPPAQEPPVQEPAQSAEAETPTGAEPPATTAPVEEDVGLPPAVERTRDAIVATAHARDYGGLEGLLDPATFSYSFGESGDPVGYWQELEEVGEVPILGDVLPTVLSMHVAKVDDVYVWPAAHAKDPRTWSENDLADLRLLYSEDDIRSFEEIGGYLGYRVGIREDGTWPFFVAGD